MTAEISLPIPFHQLSANQLTASSTELALLIIAADKHLYLAKLTFDAQPMSSVMAASDHPSQVLKMLARLLRLWGRKPTIRTRLDESSALNGVELQLHATEKA